MAALPKTVLRAGCVLLFLASPLLRAFDGPSSYVLDFPFAANQATPLWLGHPVSPMTSFATLNLPITTPDPASSLLITVFFHEKEGGFLRISWQGAQGAQVLANNFYEGIGMNNQRSLLIPAATLTGEGILSFQCSDSTLSVARVKLEWVESRNSLASPKVHELLVTPETGVTTSAQKLEGQPEAPQEGTWRNKIVTVPIVDTPQRIEQGVEFNVDAGVAPGAGRIDFKEAGLPWGKHLVVWINQQRGGTISPSVPDLNDEGYLSDSPASYVGWRNGSFFVHPSLLKAGENTIQFSVEDELTAETDFNNATISPVPLAIKDATLQFSFTTPPATVPDITPLPAPGMLPTPGAIAAPDSSEALPDSAPTGPVPPTNSASTPSETNPQ